MDYFSFGLNILCLLVQGLMHISFSSRLTGKKQRIGHFPVYIFLHEFFLSKFQA